MTDWQTRQSLIDRARDPSDQEAWQEFCDFYQPFIRFILNLNKAPSEHFDDVEQKVLIKLWKKLPEFQHNKDLGKFRTWMSKVIKNTLIDELRLQKNRQRGKEELKLEQQHRDTFNDDFDERIEEEWKIFLTKKALDKVKLRFTGKAMQVFELSMKENSPEEIATKLDLKKNTIYRLKKRVQLALREEIQALQLTYEGTQHGP
jgi:RNA polymerase sigma-70 factor (ECF subfamily)